MLSADNILKYFYYFFQSATHVSRDDLDQSAHPHSLSRAITVHMKILGYPQL